MLHERNLPASTSGSSSSFAPYSSKLPSCRTRRILGCLHGARRYPQLRAVPPSDRDAVVEQVAIAPPSSDLDSKPLLEDIQSNIQSLEVSIVDLGFPCCRCPSCTSMLECCLLECINSSGANTDHYALLRAGARARSLQHAPTAARSHAHTPAGSRQC